MEKHAGALSPEQILDQQRLLRRQVVRSSFNRFFIAAILSFPFFIQVIAMWMGYSFEIEAIWQWILATLVLFGCGWPLYSSSYESLKAKKGNMDLLVALGTTAAYSLSLVVYFWHLPHYLYFGNSVITMTLTLLGKWLEAFIQGRQSKTLEQLLHSQPRNAKIARGRQEISIDLTTAKPGDAFLVHPGDRIPVDGIVYEGEASVNEFLLTGVSMPVFKEMGSTVLAGTICERGLLHIHATKVGADTKLSQLIRLVEKAQKPAVSMSKVDKVSANFIPIVLLLSVLTWGGWAFGWGNGESGALNAFAVLVLACPCAIGLVNPLILIMAKEIGEERGILFKDLSSLEKLKQLKILFLEKTGTLTEGRPIVSAIYPHAKHPKQEVLQLAASLENVFSHPLVKAISNRAKHEGIALKCVKDFEVTEGKGVFGSIDGKVYYLGSLSFAKEMGIEVEPALALLERKGDTLLLIWTTKHLVGLISLIDQVRPNSLEAIRLLKERGIHPILLTGDRKGTAESVAHHVGIEDVRYELLPAEKKRAIREAKIAGTLVGMVGDEISDAKALAEADVSLSLGMNRDVRFETTAITLKRHDLMGVVDAIELSSKVMSKMKQNLFLAFIYNILAIPLAAAGLLNPMVVAGTMAMSLVSVIANALLLRYWKPSRE